MLVAVKNSRSNHQGTYLVVDDEGNERGIVYKLRNTRSTTYRLSKPTETGRSRF